MAWVKMRIPEKHPWVFITRDESYLWHRQAYFKEPTNGLNNQQTK